MSTLQVPEVSGPRLEAGPTSTPKGTWVFVFVLLGSTILNFLDRQTLSILAPTIMGEFRLSNTDYAMVISVFQVSYMVMYSLGGRLSDILGVRRGLTIFVVWWSVACMLQALVTGARSLALVRSLLAVGEGGNWPAAVKAVAERVPASARPLAVGIVNSGSSLGAIIAPLLVGWLALRFNWRVAFIATGMLGFIWLPIWLYVTRHHPRPGPGTKSGLSIPWSRLFRFRQAWAIFLGRLLGDQVWFFYVFWLPSYLDKERHLSLAGIASVAWIPFAAAAAGNCTGGAVAGILARRGWSLDSSRKLVLFIAAAGASIGVTAAFSSSLAVAMAAISATAFFYMAWAVTLQTLTVDFFPPSYVGTVFGFAGSGSSLGTMLTAPLIGIIVDTTDSYGAIMIAAGLLLPVTQILVAVVAGRVRRLEIGLQG
jgi:MFS transporter, ACS family, hexuronate transporter